MRNDARAIESRSWQTDEFRRRQNSDFSIGRNSGED